MKLGLQIPYFTWEGGPPGMRQRLADMVRTADDAGFSSIWVMDHYFQIPGVGTVEQEMMEAYTTLGFIAAHTSRARLGTLCTGMTYRHPGILAKQVSTLDVLSGGRAWLGIGASWFEREHDGLGVPFPPLKERFERLEEGLQVILQMWSDDNGPYEGKHYRLKETINVPQPLTKPRPPILIGGGGERKTLRMVARYGDACNIFGDPATIAHKYDVLRRHCEAEGRNYDDITKTAYVIMSVGPNGENTGALLEQLGKLAEVGVQEGYGGVVMGETLKPLEAIGRDVIPQIESL